MLVLSRRLNESIIIGDPADPNAIRLKVVDIDRGRVRLGLECPRHIPIIREELVTPEQRQPKKPA